MPNKPAIAKHFFSSSLHSNSNPSLSHPPTTLPTPTYPSSHLLSLLQNFKTKNQLSQIHAQFTSTGLIHNPFAAKKLVLSYLNPLFRSASIAHSITDRNDRLNTYTWNMIIRSYLEEKNPKQGVLVYTHMRKKGLEIDSYTVLFLTKACGLLQGVNEGREIHGQILRMGFDSEVIIRTALMQMYGFCEDLDSTQKVFDEMPQRDLVVWNALIAIYAHMNKPNEAFLVSCAMVRENVNPNVVTIVSVLSACSCLRAFKQGRSVHGYAIKNIIGMDVYAYNALLNMYAVCGCLVGARRVFDKMLERNVISWTSMMNGYSINDSPNEALALFKEMENSNVRPDQVTILGLISMCTKSKSSELGKRMDHYIRKNGFEGITCIANALMDMHSKCGNIRKACQVFDTMVLKTLISWTTMIQGLAMHGHGRAALLRFSQMQREGFEPDHITFLSVLCACSHAGLVDEGYKCFRSMDEYDAEPSMEHYGCMVDLLCRAKLVEEAFEFVESMPMKPDVIIWRTLLGACRSQGNVDLARQVIDHLLELEPRSSEDYILISNLYATKGEWDTVMKLRDEMARKGIAKRDPAYSLIEVDSAST